MIGYIKGQVIFQDLNQVIIEAGGIGYEIHTSPTTSQSVKQGDLISLWIYTCLRQDSLDLYGFSSQKEKTLFLSLLKVKGIGPKMALLVLGACPLEQFIRMISEENIKALSALPKIGKKTAQQIVLSLKDKISDKLVGSVAKDPYREQLFSALSYLGFHPQEIKTALEQIKWEQDLKKDIKQALSVLKSRG